MATKKRKAPEVVADEEVEAEVVQKKAKRDETPEERAARKAAKKAAKLAAMEVEEVVEEPIVEKKSKADETPEERAARKAAKKAAKAAAAKAEPEVVPKKTEKKMAKSTGSSGGVQRCFYTESKSVTSMSEEEVAAFRDELAVTVVSNGVPVDLDGSGVEAHSEPDIRPIRTFAESGLSKQLLACCATFDKPTPIQAQCWPAILSGRDVIGIAETGSGKTLGFVMPALVHVQAQKPLKSADRSPIVLVLAPTRELALQTTEVCEAAGAAVNMQTTCIYGGVPKHEQIQALRKGSHFVVATPGRLLGLIDEGHITLKRVTYLVLDEADRMLDLGFEPDIRAIIGHIGCPPSERQTLLFSATWPREIQKLGSEFVRTPFHIRIGRTDPDELTANARVTQTIEVIDEFKRDKRLVELLQKFHASRKNRIIIFVLYKKDVDRVLNSLSRAGFHAAGLSGDRNQAQRTQAIEDFKSGKQPLLVATDVAARGLDIPNVEYVLNYGFPLTIEDYVHRIGRTGRGGKSGHSYTFFTQRDKALSGYLIKILQDSKATVPQELMAFGTATKKKEHALYGFHFRDDKRPMAAKKHIKF